MNKKSKSFNKYFNTSNSGCKNDEGKEHGCTIPPDPKLLADGWERRYIADARMAREAVDTYGELGYEVRIEPVKTDELKDECSGCKSMFEQFSAVYTRKKRPQYCMKKIP